MTGHGDGGGFAAGACGDFSPELLGRRVATDGRPGGLLQNPANVGGTGLGEPPSTLHIRRLEGPGVQSGITDNRLAVGEAGEVPDLAQHGGGGDQAHAGHAVQQVEDVFEYGLLDKSDQIPLALLDLPLEETQLIVGLPEDADVALGQELALAAEIPGQPIGTQGGGAGAVVQVHQAPDSMQAAGVAAAEIVAMPRPVSQFPDVRRRRVGDGQSAAEQKIADVVGILPVGLDASAGQASAGGGIGIGQQKLVNDPFEQIPEPAIKPNRFDGDDRGAWQRAEIFDDLLPAFAGQLLKVNLAGGWVDEADGEGVIVQVHAGEGLERRQMGNNGRNVTYHDDLHVRGQKDSNTLRKDTLFFRRPLHGFTLVEMLIVIGIISILIAMLLPALNKARQAANRVACASNLRQMGIGVQMYVSEYQGYLPCAIAIESNLDAPYYFDSFITQIAWVLGQLKDDPHGIHGSPTSKMYICPSDTDPYYLQLHNWTGFYSSYGANLSAFIYHGVGSTNRPYRANKIKLPSSLVIIGDTDDQSFGIDIPLYWSAINTNPWYYEVSEKYLSLYPRHNGGVNLLMLDGHVEYHKFPMKPAREEQNYWLRSGTATSDSTRWYE